MKDEFKVGDMVRVISYPDDKFNPVGWVGVVTAFDTIFYDVRFPNVEEVYLFFGEELEDSYA